MSKWIKVTDRLPEEFTDVLCFQEGYNPRRLGIMQTYYNPDQEFPFIMADGEGEVTHWMPLPEPPDKV